MTRLAWGAPGDRYFETGVDRGVLYLAGQVGVPWNGLTAVNEAPTGGEPRPYYVDGYKYLNIASAEEYKATLSALSAPLEFGECDGIKPIHNGLFASQQPRKPFGLSYRTLVGNDIQGVDHGYKLHVVYNALAAPTSKNHETAGQGSRPLGLTWSITTLPPYLTGLRPTAHLVIDSRLTPPALMAAIEDILYGSAEEDATLPPVEELVALFQSVGPVVRTNYIQNPNFVTGSGWSTVMGNASYPGDGSMLYTATGTSGSNLVRADAAWGTGVFSEGDALSAGMVVENLNAYDVILRMAPHDGSNPIPGEPILVPSGESRLIFLEQAVVPAGASHIEVRLQVGGGFSSVSGNQLRITEPLLEKRVFLGEFFSGDTLDTPTTAHAWEDEENSSPSLARSWY